MPNKLIKDLIDKGAVTLKEQGYSIRSREYTLLTWKQFQEFCNKKGYETYLPSHKDEFITELGKCTPPLRQSTIDRKAGSMKMLDLLATKGTWGKGIMKYFETMVPSRQCPTAHLVFPLLFKTLICCGLRAGEATRLRVKDVDLINGVLQIWETKHDKPRYVPLSKSLWADYEQYFEEIHAESSGNNYFFPNPRKSCYHTTTVYNRFRDALWHCGIAHKGRGYGPRVHDLRHTFAVRSMQKLKKSKSDIVTTLPYLSAYLGHCNMSATQIYLHLTAECYPEFIQKQCDYLGDTIPTWEAPNENC